MTTETFFESLKFWTIIALAVEVILLIALVPALMKVNKANAFMVENTEKWIYELRDLRVKVRTAKEGAKGLEVMAKFRLPSMLASGPLKVILPLVMRIL